MLRGFTAFDIFLEQHPEFRERVTFIAHLQPSRQDVPEYVEYLEKIEALVAVINHRHGTTDWMPIDLRLRDDFEEAVALYKHYDLLLVNAMWDGMNLVSKEGPLVNTRDGMIVLSENTGAHEELGECALSVNPFDVQEQADAMHHALTASPSERRQRMETLRRIITSRTPADWIDDAARRHRAKARDPRHEARSACHGPNSPTAGAAGGHGGGGEGAAGTAAVERRRSERPLPRARPVPARRRRSRSARARSPGAGAAGVLRAADGDRTRAGRSTASGSPSAGRSGTSVPRLGGPSANSAATARTNSSRATLTHRTRASAPPEACGR